MLEDLPSRRAGRRSATKVPNGEGPQYSHITAAHRREHPDMGGRVGPSLAMFPRKSRAPTDPILRAPEPPTD